MCEGSTFKIILVQKYDQQSILRYQIKQISSFQSFNMMYYILLGY